MSGQCVSLAEKLKCNLNDLTLAQLKEIRFDFSLEVLIFLRNHACEFELLNVYIIGIW